MAAWGGEPGLALGNAVGSIIADTGLIFGLGCLITVLPVDPFVLRRQGWVQFGSAVLLAVLCYASFARYGSAAESWPRNPMQRCDLRPPEGVWTTCR